MTSDQPKQSGPAGLDAATQAQLLAWQGRTESTVDLVLPGPLAGLACALDQDLPPLAPGSPIEPLRHWLFFNSPYRARELGPDGHPQRGGFLPPVPLQRRMWAGSELCFHQPIRVGEALRRDSHIAEVAIKHGRSGPLVFVTVEHQLHGPQGLALTDRHQLVYRNADAPSGAPTRPAIPAPPPPAQPPAEFGRTLRADPVLLFRYSALTNNGHRIHYDQPYATGVEGYPGLVVHGPLIATLLLDQLRGASAGRRLCHYRFRALGPLFDQAPFQIAGAWLPGGKCANLWACNPAGALAMQAEAEFD